MDGSRLLTHIRFFWPLKTKKLCVKNALLEKGEMKSRQASNRSHRADNDGLVEGRWRVGG